MMAELRQKSIKELEELISQWKADLFALRFQKTTGELKETHKFKKLKISIARALTVIEEKQKGGSK